MFGGMHSEFVRIVLTKDPDGLGPNLDRQQPVSREHIEKAAEKKAVRKKAKGARRKR